MTSKIGSDCSTLLPHNLKHHTIIIKQCIIVVFIEEKL